MADTPLSLPPEEDGLQCVPKSPFRRTRQSVPDAATELGINHESLSRDGAKGTSSLACYSDCVISGKSVEQIANEAVIDYLHQRAIPAKQCNSFIQRE